MNIKQSNAGLGDPIPPEVVRHANAVAHSMVGTSGIRYCDMEDICQEFYQQLILAAEKYTPEKGSYYSYACGVIDRYKNRIYRERIQRGYDSFPLQDLCEQDNEDTNERLFEAALCSARREVLCKQVRDFVETLAGKERKFCELILGGENTIVAAEKAGVGKGCFFYSVFFPGLKAKFEKEFF